jgi:hypothetical protein
MKIENRRLNPLLLPLVAAAACGALFAQDVPPETPSTTDFQNHGEVTVGYRFADVRGYRPKFVELFNLREGFRLQDFTLSGDARSSSNRFADSYSLSATGLGGDPFATAQLKVGKTGLYDLRAQWRQSYYYWNQNDNVALPISTAAASLSTGLTANHDWATVRKSGSVDLTVHATNNLRFNLDVYRTTTDGNLLTTRSLDFFNSPSFWGSFARANPYPLNAPLNDETNRFAGGIDYSWQDWDFHYRTGFQSFNENIALSLLAPGEVSINPITLSTLEPLTQLSWSQTRRLSTPLSEFSFQGKLHPSVEWRGGYVYTRYRGPALQDFSFGGIAPNSSGALAPYTASEAGRAQVTEPSHAVNQGFTWRTRDWLAVNVDYRYTRYTSDAISTVESIFNGALAGTGQDEVVWTSGVSDLEFSMTLTPIDNLVIRPGIRLSKADIKTLENGVVDGARTLRTKHARPELRFGYKPLPKLSFRGDIHSSTSGSSYTAITPHTTVSGKLIARFEPLANLSIENALTVSNSRLIDAHYRNSIRANTITVAYALEERFSAFGSVGYESFFAQGDIVYARGTSPLLGVLRDQEIHRVWQAGLDVKPARYVGFRFSGNYDRLTGQGEISGEPPAYGPLKWPLATGTVYFETPRLGRLSVDFQRTYYAEELVPANNFSANLLTLRFTRRF